MAVSRALRRLRSVLELEEEQARGALERALGELRRLEAARSAVLERERAARRLVADSAGNGEIVDRLAGIEEERAARRLAAVLKMRIAEAARQTAARRAALLAKRVERQQAATLIEEAQAAEAVEVGRREQQSTDEWFLGRRRQATRGERAPECTTLARGEPEAGAKKT